MEKSAAVFGLVMICSSFWFKRTELTHTKATKATPGACAPSTHHTHTNTLARSLCMLMRQGTFDGSKHTAEPVRHPEGGGFKKKEKKEDMFSLLQGLWENDNGCDFFYHL